MKTLNKADMKHLPPEIIAAADKTEFNGGILPLLPLLGLIFGGISAASAVAGTTASAVLQKQKNDEEKRSNEEKERIMREAAKGEGIPEDEDEIKKTIALLSW